jgi:hypothetical protein
VGRNLMLTFSAQFFFKKVLYCRTISAQSRTISHNLRTMSAQCLVVLHFRTVSVHNLAQSPHNLRTMSGCIAFPHNVSMQ